MPEEFAAAYRAAYERALAEQSTGPRHREEPDRDPDEAEDDGTRETPLPRRRGPLRVGTHRSEDVGPEDDSSSWFDQVTRASWFVPLLLALLALLLILGAYAVGRMFSGQVSSDDSPDSRPSLVMGDDDKEQLGVTVQEPGTGAWEGKVTPIEGVEAKVDCTSEPGLEASGDRVPYYPSHLTDGVAETTWRCDGRAIGEEITLDLGETLPVAEVGLIPGYAKTDETSKADRYAENNRITRVRWTLGDLEVVQRFKPAPENRTLRVLRVPRTRSDTVELEILAVRQGPRNTTAISEIHLARAGE